MCTQTSKDIDTELYKASDDEEDQCVINHHNYKCFNAATHTKSKPGTQILIKAAIAPPNRKPIAVEMLVDSGSSICLVQKRIVDKLQKLGLRPTKIKKIDLAGATGLGEVDNEIQLPITITNGKDYVNLKHTFLVVDMKKVEYDCILGNDLLNKILDSINYRTRTVNFITSRKAAACDKIIKIPLIKEKHTNTKSSTASMSFLIRELHKPPKQSKELKELFTKGYIRLYK